MSETTARVLPSRWQLTAAELERICGKPVDAQPAEVLVDDVEGLCRGALADAQHRGLIGRDIETADWLEVLGFLLGEVVKRGQNYNPAKQRASAPRLEFRPWLYDQLRCFSVVDAQRWLYGRDGRHRVPEGPADVRIRDKIGRDDPDSGATTGTGPYDWGAFSDDPAYRGRSRGAPADPADDWIASFAGLQPAGYRDQAGTVGAGGVAGNGGDPQVHGRSGVGARGRVAGAAGRAAHWLDCVACGWRSFPQPPNGTPDWHYEATCPACGAEIMEAA